MAEDSQSKLDRELIELLNELRVALPGVQVLFAFLLAVPFSQRFGSVTSTQKAGIFTALAFTTISSILLIAPSAQHRLLFRQHDKEALIQRSNRLAIAGVGALAIAMSAVVFVITDLLYGSPLSVVATILSFLAFAFTWFALPVLGKRD
ncbi:MAG TPA: DUF6328 family protein [Actinomycetota bacterium]|nr:DUF6328 family protein [Actinomycetota bacterium]